jgi:hypothetical protein
VIQLGDHPDTGKFGKLAVNGTAYLDGKLTVSLVAPFVPSVGDKFKIVTFASLSGGFASTSLPPGGSLVSEMGDLAVQF